jgi:hypothetical protein
MIRKTVVLLCACQVFLWAGNVVTTQPGEIIATPRSSATPTRLLFGYASTQAGFDTEIAISNTSQDPFLSVAQAGTCTLSFYAPYKYWRGACLGISDNQRDPNASGGDGLLAGGFPGFHISDRSFWRYRGRRLRRRPSDPRVRGMPRLHGAVRGESEFQRQQRSVYRLNDYQQPTQVD